MKPKDFNRYPATGLDCGLGRSGTFYTAPLWKTGGLGRGVPPAASGVSWPMFSAGTGYGGPSQAAWNLWGGLNA